MKKELDFENEFEKRQPKRTHLLRFMREAMGVERVTWDMLTKVNLIDVADHIKCVCSPNSAKVYYAIICAFLKLYQEEGIIPCKHPEEVLKCKKVPQQNVALTEEELHRIEEYYDKLWNTYGHKEEKDCLTLFLIEAICGARSCDVEKLTVNNINNHMLTYVSKKTHIMATIPEHSRLRQLLERKPKRTYFNMTKNRIIKRVAKKVGITQPVTIFYRGAMITKPKCDLLGTHSARRSFASILSEKGVPTPEISQYMSHASIEMTNRYIIVDNQKISEAALSFFYK